MIDRTNKCQEKQLNSIKEKLFENSSFDETKSLLTELNQIEETFRNPNLLIETIKEMQRKQDESLRDIQSKLNEINQVKDNLKASNEFQPNLSFFDQEDQTSLFGSIKLLENQSNVNSLKCEILNNQQQYFDLIKLCEFSPNDKWSLLYRGTRDGFGSDVFHSKCDGHTNTLTLFKAKQSSYIFGGFASVDWDSSMKCKSDPNAFLFSLTNKDNTPMKMKVDLNYEDRAIRCDSELGPSFGFDVNVVNNANTSIDSYSRLGDSYSHPQYRFGTKEAEAFLAGSKYFQLDEIEVYLKE